MDGLTLLIVFLLVICFLVILAWFFYRSNNLVFPAIATVTATFQFYSLLPIIGIYPSISTVASILSVKSINLSQLIKFGWVRAFLMLESFRFVSIFWSPQPMLGIRNLIYEIPFLFIVSAFASPDPVFYNAKQKIIYYSLLSISANAILVILFRLFPQIELLFLSSFIAKIFMGTNAIESFLYESDVFSFTTLDPDKAGGFFFNGNVAATFLGIGAMGGWFIGQVQKSFILKCSGILCWCAVFFTGSKAAVMIALILPCLLYMLGLICSNTLTLQKIIVFLCVSLTFAVSLQIAYMLLSDSAFLHNSSSTLDSRKTIWSYALQAFPSHFFTGLGFGGWSQSAPLLAINGYRSTMPEHSLFLKMWSESGILALLVSIYYWFALPIFLIKYLILAKGVDVKIVMAALGSTLWIYFGTLGENYGFVGELHITPIFAMLIGYAVHQISSTNFSSRV